jgi:hypothetical protein
MGWRDGVIRAGSRAEAAPAPCLAKAVLIFRDARKIKAAAQAKRGKPGKPACADRIDGGP